MTKLLINLYRLAIVFWVGGVAIFTFVLTPIIFKTYSRDVAGGIVGALFPAYFRWGLICGATALVSLFWFRGRLFAVQVLLLAVMIAATSIQAFYIEPRAALLKRDIPSFESTTKDHPLRKQFSRLHAASAACNLVVFGGGVALVILL